MDGGFYARYVPPKSAISKPKVQQEDQEPPIPNESTRDVHTTESKSSKKRKRDRQDELSDAEHKSRRVKSSRQGESKDAKHGSKRRTQHEQEADVDERKSAASEENDSDRDEKPSKKKKKHHKDKKATRKKEKKPAVGLHESLDTESRLNKEHENDVARDEGKSKVRDHGSVKEQEELREHEAELGATRERKKEKKRKKREKESTKEAQPSEHDQAEQYDRKHAAVLSKFKKSVQPPSKTVKPEGEEDQEPEAKEEPILHELEPIPQPEADSDVDALPAYSTVPKWISEPIIVPATKTDTAFESLNVDPTLAQRLAKKGFTEALPVQAGVLPLLLPTAKQHRADLCVSAATGSGKTLGYVLPIIQSLTPLKLTKLRALVILPTRELVNQVHKVVELCAAVSGLKAGTAVGSRSLEEEKSSLMKQEWRYDPDAYHRRRAKLSGKPSDPSAEDEDQEDTDSDDSENTDWYARMCALSDPARNFPDHVPQHRSAVDILVCTPGRLVEHLRSTKGFDISTLEWLVIDEADRLLDESFQEWAEILTKEIAKPAAEPFNPFAGDPVMSGMFFDPIRRGPKKVVLSATMSTDLDKLSALRLRDPRLVLMADDVDQSAARAGTLTLPPTLQEFTLAVKDAAEKPMHLYQLLLKMFSNNQNDDTETEHPPPTALIFAHSNESAARLSTLLSHLLSNQPTHHAPLTPANLSTLTKSSSTAQTRTILHSLTTSHKTPTQKPRTLILITTDRSSRGLDIPNLSHVVNYDVPTSLENYVHRVGRTARAGRRGEAWSLLEGRQGAWFWGVIGDGGANGETGSRIERRSRAPIRRFKFMELVLEASGGDEGAVGGYLEGLRGRYESALAALRRDVEGEGGERGGKGRGERHGDGKRKKKKE